MPYINEVCINGTLVGARYSAPVPVIGVYIAGASVLLLLIMLYDITVAGFRARKRWLPCKYFTLNSVILTLLGVAAKLPVDLTTPMPRPVDQLSKLTATVLICVAMGFMLPSVKRDERSKWNADLVALTIFVITVIVNICVQLSTGVIMLFIWEHIVIMCLMLLLLCFLWHSSALEHFLRIAKELPKRSPEFTWNGWEGLFDNFRKCYQVYYNFNNQIVICKGVNNSSMGGLCVICSVILSQAAIRSLVLKRLEFCSGISDYGWSTWIIVVSQMLFVLIGCFSTTYRWLTMMTYRDESAREAFGRSIEDVENARVFRGRSALVSTVNTIWRIILFICVLTLFLVQLSFECVTRLLKLVLMQRSASEYRYHERDWRNRKITEDMNRLVEVGKKEPLNNLRQLLSRTCFRQMHPLDDNFDSIDLYFNVCIRIGSLAKLYEVLLPDTLRGSIVGAFAEVEQLLLFIHTAKTGDHQSVIPANIQQMWDDMEYHNFGIPSLDPESDESHITNAISDFYQVLCGVRVITPEFGVLVDLERTSSSEYVFCYVEVNDFGHNARYSSVADLAKSMEQLFIDYLGILLVDFPEAVEKFLRQGPDEEFEKRLDISMKWYCIVEPLTNVCPWWEKPALTGEVEMDN